jgi:predicted nucleotidyltransferase component of viral defense system
MTSHERPVYHEDVDWFRDALFFTQSETGFSARLVEKDYYCSLLLEDVLAAGVPGLAFKGGTSLSKVHAEFYRLSEDLDLGISTPADAPRSQRSKRVAALKGHLAGTAKRASCFQVVAPLRGYNNSTQYSGRVSYRSLVTGQDDFIKLEVSVREPIIEPTERLPARTLLMDPFRRVPALDPIPVATLSCREAYAEKLRAALTRRDPAIRDYYDVDHALRTGRIQPKDRRLIDLVRRKLAVPGNEPIDMSKEKLEELRKQVDVQLKPVLRERDFSEFDVDHALETVRHFAKALFSKGRHS